jgi:hypothetical protein
MIVFLTGMPRSGSTFSFNVVREVLRRRGRVYQEPTPDSAAALAHSGEADHVIIKAHFLDPLGLSLIRTGAARAICSVRRIEDAVASWIETFGFAEEESIEAMRAWLVLYQHIRSQALTVPYDLIDRRPWRAAWLIGRHISATVGPVESWKIACRFNKERVKRSVDALDRTGQGVRDIGFSWYDETTFFHRRHVSSLASRPAEQRLSGEQLARIRLALERMARDAKVPIGKAGQ